MPTTEQHADCPCLHSLDRLSPVISSRHIMICATFRSQYALYTQAAMLSQTELSLLVVVMRCGAVVSPKVDAGLPSTPILFLVMEQGTHDLCSLIFSKKGQNDNKQQSKAVPLQSDMTLALSFVVILPFVAINQVVAKVTSSLLHNRNKTCRRWQGFRRHYDLITITQKSWPEYNPTYIVFL